MTCTFNPDYINTYLCMLDVDRNMCRATRKAIKLAIHRAHAEHVAKTGCTCRLDTIALVNKRAS